MGGLSEGRLEQCVVVHVRRLARWIANVMAPFAGCEQAELSLLARTHASACRRLASLRTAAWIAVGFAWGETTSESVEARRHACIAVAGRIERVKTLQTGTSDRVANMHTFAAAALTLLEESLA